MNLARHHQVGSGRAARRAFTLIEMLVVLGIIGVLAAMTLPSFKNAGKGNVLETAMRQLQDDLAQARLKAMSSRSKVYVVFAPDYDWFTNWYSAATMTSPATTNFFFFNQAANNVLGGQLTSYALYSPRTPGDQPGQSTPRYLSEWHSLPDGAFIPRGAFQNAALFHNVPGSPQTNDIPVDDVAGAVQLRMPYIAFDEQGRLHRHVGPLQLPVMEGSVSQLKESNGLTNLVVTTDAVETSLPVTTGQIVPGVIYLVGGPPGSQVRYPPAGTNFYSAGQTFTGLSIPAFTAIAGPDGPPRVVQYYGVMVDPLTGRARSVRPEIQ